MRFGHIVSLISISSCLASTLPTSQSPVRNDDRSINPALYAELEELARVVDITYCVGISGIGIAKPFRCASRCQDFENFELVRSWNTGALLSDSSGYIALSHAPSPARIIVAFRGTYSLANTVADLSTIPQGYTPYPGSSPSASDPPDDEAPRCHNCTVHTGFHTSWINTRAAILSEVEHALQVYPNYTLTLVGHSLGGAVACLAGLDLLARGWAPKITTFGEPMLGNEGLAGYVNERFGLVNGTGELGLGMEQWRYRRVTHASDPVPLLPPVEWGYRPHAGEIHIQSSELPPKLEDIVYCKGDQDERCIAGSRTSRLAARNIVDVTQQQATQVKRADQSGEELEADRWWMDVVPDRFRLWQLFFAHRDYFWRLGLCVPGGDGWKWVTGQAVVDEREEL